MKHNLLIVDDEENIINALKRLLRRDGYHILTATRAQAGFVFVIEKPVSKEKIDTMLQQTVCGQHLCD